MARDPADPAFELPLSLRTPLRMIGFGASQQRWVRARGDPVGCPRLDTLCHAIGGERRWSPAIPWNVMGARILYLVRHGQYFSEEDHRHYGHLTTLGRRQAKRTAKRLAQLEFNGIFHSDLTRAVETARFIGAELGNVPTHCLRALRELMPPLPKRPGLTPRSREEIAEVRAATPILVKKFFTAPRGRRTRTDLIVAHGNLIRYLIRLALGEPLHRWGYFATHNAGISILVIRQKPSPNYLVSYNDIGHLPRAMQTMM